MTLKSIWICSWQWDSAASGFSTTTQNFDVLKTAWYHHILDTRPSACH